MSDRRRAGNVEGGANENLERLHARLSEYVQLTGINITNLNPLQFQITGDPDNRLTFVRDQCAWCAWAPGTSFLSTR